MIVRAKRIYLLMIKENKLFSFFFFVIFVFLSESLGESKRQWKYFPVGSCSHSISRSPKLPLAFLQLDTNTEHVFDLLNT